MVIFHSYVSLPEGRVLENSASVGTPNSELRREETCTFDGEPHVLSVKGRHDPCVLPRAPPLVEGMMHGCQGPTRLAGWGLPFFLISNFETKSLGCPTFCKFAFSHFFGFETKLAGATSCSLFNMTYTKCGKLPSRPKKGLSQCLNIVYPQIHSLITIFPIKLARVCTIFRHIQVSHWECHCWWVIVVYYLVYWGLLYCNLQ